MTHLFNHFQTNIFSSPILLTQTHFSQRVSLLHILTQISRPRWRKSHHHKTKPKGPIMTAWSQEIQSYRGMLSFLGQLYLSKATVSNLHHSPHSSYLYHLILGRWSGSLLHKKEIVTQKSLSTFATKPTHHMYLTPSSPLSLNQRIREGPLHPPNLCSRANFLWSPWKVDSSNHPLSFFTSTTPLHSIP